MTAEKGNGDKLLRTDFIRIIRNVHLQLLADMDKHLVMQPAYTIRRPRDRLRLKNLLLVNTQTLIIDGRYTTAVSAAFIEVKQVIHTIAFSANIKQNSAPYK